MIHLSVLVTDEFVSRNWALFYLIASQGIVNGVNNVFYYNKCSIPSSLGPAAADAQFIADLTGCFDVFLSYILQSSVNQ
jgi:hypothetical protein